MTKKKKKKKTSFSLLIVLILFVALIFVLAKYYYTKGLIVKEYGIKNNKIDSSFDGFKIIHISDIHYKTTVFESDLVKILKEVNKYKPDIIVFTGDLFSDEVTYNDKDIEDLNNFMSSLDANIAKYAINGEDDADNHFETIISTSGFKLLNNTNDLIYYNSNKPILIGGVDVNSPDYEKALNTDKENLYKILLLHMPDNVKNFNLSNTDLILAGHSHGGQIRIPFVGPICNFEGAKIYNNEYTKLNNTQMYISSGIGTSKYPYRFLSKPSINLYRLYNN